MKKVILEGSFSWLDREPETGTLVKFKGTDQEGRSFTSTIGRLFRRFTPNDPGTPGQKVRITIEPIE